jgi:hypothetical protein
MRAFSAGRLCRGVHCVSLVGSFLVDVAAAQATRYALQDFWRLVLGPLQWTAQRRQRQHSNNGHLC